ncbi:MAG: hypothetical protein QM626_06770 [Microbacterium sp.]|uniref:FitA-like ribbon-helix-helix domain-containing protein n=1 Tax=Microbacterium sp. TaxID=51671 RepID=UPI0039E30149
MIGATHVDRGCVRGTQSCILHARTMGCMSSLQIRDVPEDVHRVLKARAAASGRSLSEFALDVLRRESSRPTLEELLERSRLRGTVDIADAAVTSLRAERDAR